MTAPSSKNIDKTAIYMWDDTNKRYVALGDPNNPLPVYSEAEILAEYQFQDLREASPLTYVGYMKNDGSWLFKKLDENTDLSMTYANVSNNAGVTTYADAFTNRATLTYENFDQLTF
jgi:hypothetical protein